MRNSARPLQAGRQGDAAGGGGEQAVGPVAAGRRGEGHERPGARRRGCQEGGAGERRQRPGAVEGEDGAGVGGEAEGEVAGEFGKRPGRRVLGIVGLRAGQGRIGAQQHVLEAVEKVVAFGHRRPFGW